MLLLHLHALLDSPLCFAERAVLKLADQFGIQTRLLGGNGIQVAHAIHVVLHGCHVQRCVIVIVQAPYVGPKRHKEEKAVEVTVGCSKVKRCVAPYVTLVWVSSVRRKCT